MAETNRGDELSDRTDNDPYGDREAEKRQHKEDDRHEVRGG